MQITLHNSNPVGTISPVEHRLPRLSNPRVGQFVAIQSRGSWRIAKITKVGRTRIATAYTTESAIEVERTATQAGYRALVTRKSVDIADAYAIPRELIESAATREP